MEKWFRTRTVLSEPFQRCGAGLIGPCAISPASEIPCLRAAKISKAGSIKHRTSPFVVGSL